MTVAVCDGFEAEQELQRARERETERRRPQTCGDTFPLCSCARLPSQMLRDFDWQDNGGDGSSVWPY